MQIYWKKRCLDKNRVQHTGLDYDINMAAVTSCDHENTL